MNWIADMFGWMNQKIDQLLAGQKNIEKQVEAMQAAQVKIQIDVAQILKYVSPRPAAAFELTIQNVEGEEEMAKNAAKGKLKINILDNGSCVATLTVLDVVGIPTAWDGAALPVYTTNNPAVTLTPASDGMSCAVAITQPPALATGIVVSVSGVNAAGNTLTADNSANPINIISGPAGSFVLSVA